MATMLSQELVGAKEADDTVRDFMRRFELGKGMIYAQLVIFFGDRIPE